MYLHKKSASTKIAYFGILKHGEGGFKIHLTLSGYCISYFLILRQK